MISPSYSCAFRHRDSVHVEWRFQDRSFKLVDTAGLTRVMPDQRLLRPEVDRKYKDVFNSLGFGTSGPSKTRTPNVRVVLPGIEVRSMNALKVGKD